MSKFIWKVRFALRMLIKSRWITGIKYIWQCEAAGALEIWGIDDSPEDSANEAMTYWSE